MPALRVLTLLTLTLPLLWGCGAGRGLTMRGELAGAQHWQGRIYIQGDVVIPPGASLEIDPGSEVLFLPPGADDLYREHPHFPGSELIVRGTLRAEGTKDAPIRFAAADPAAAPGSWGGINLQQSPSASFRFCHFSQADSALHSQESEVYVEDSVFADNLVGIRFHTSRILIENNLLHRNGVAIRFHFGAPVICHNDIRDNDKGFFITAHPRDYHIEGNRIAGNREANIVLGEEVPENVALPRNDWGTTDLEAIAGSFFDGRRVDYLGRIEFLPLAPVARSVEVPRCSR
ncbi:MAG: hypothetical protein A2091_11020 [Desulfuromonadales bacterium GWD2_61_12]|nr:MAG: hypothetical protein A2005_10620 [Desulfuromonadales bacterium GWC2_61_20]OGR35191.1 MAG: hypothetical protein A2091_11020 [Desulfuromonadales bacterium GWD2_61_12]HAD04068.1 hypothetical protein [Desulfuromonas sp.]HBT83497.1 hypothetical protein [Desulfuromonas sp.]